MALTYAVTQDLKTMTIVGVFDVVIKLFFYYVHERAWGRINLGRNVSPKI